LENAIHSLVEILHRFDVKEIEPRERVDSRYRRWLSRKFTRRRISARSQSVWN